MSNDRALHQATVWHFQEQRQPPLDRTITSSGNGSGDRRSKDTRLSEGVSRLSEDIYSAALDHLVIACVDVVFTHQAHVLLVKRNRYPRRSWWIVGGRMRVGESPVQTAIRKTSQELSLHNIDASRLQYVGTYSTCFAVRHQPPQHHGSHTLNVTYWTELTAIEKEQITLHPSEHETWEWLAIDRVHELLCTDHETDHHKTDHHDADQEMDRALWRVILDVKRLMPN